MKLSTALLPQLIAPHINLSDHLCVVIDVLRATTVMATAAENGAREILTAAQVDDAFSLAESDIRTDAVDPNDAMGSATVLGGERDCVRVEGFQCGNSPSEYSPDVVRGKRVVLTTTNGTAAIAAVQDAKAVITAAFVNLRAAARLCMSHQSILLVCSGTHGAVTLEDILCAGALGREILRSAPEAQIDDSTRISLSAWEHHLTSGRSLTDELQSSQGGRNLLAKGYDADVERCAQINTIDTVPQQISGTPPTFVSAPRPQ